jgi:hypothetical protein
MKHYKVIKIAEGGCSTVLFGAAPLKPELIEENLNREATQGWKVIFQIIERSRYLLFWSRETMIVTLEKDN